jgi:hypothetical protein
MLPAVIQTVLFQTDAPELVLAKDLVGRQYLCSLIERNENGDQFLVVPISPVRLAQFRTGGKDLRAVLVESETGEHYEGWFKRIDGRPSIAIEPLRVLPDDWLPDEGFFLNQYYRHVEDSEVVREALARNTAVVVCALDPPEARDSAKIDADRLLQYVGGFQALVKHVVNEINRKLPKTQRAQFGLVPGALQVFEFSEASFKIHFQAKHQADLFGSSQVGQALATIDELMQASGVPVEQGLETVRKNKGLVVGAYKKVLRFIASESAPLTYRWADPSMAGASGAVVTPTEAAAMSAAIEHEKDLESEIRVIRGRFERLVKGGSWAIMTEERRIVGEVHEDYPNALAGAVFENQLYDLTCEERVAETAIGKQTTKFFLISVQKVQEE